MKSTRELIEVYADAWMVGEYDAEPEHIQAWLEDEDLWTDEDRETLSTMDLADLAQSIADYINSMTNKEDKTMKKYFVKTNAYNGLIVTANDDETVACFFDAETKEAAEQMDISNVEGMTAEEMKNEYPNHVFDFDLAEFDDIEEML